MRMRLGTAVRTLANGSSQIRKREREQFARAAGRMQQLFKENRCWYAGERQLPNKNVQKRETPELSAHVLERTLVNRAYQLTRRFYFSSIFGTKIVTKST